MTQVDGTICSPDLIQNTQIERIAKEVASANLSPQVVQRVLVDHHQ